MIPENWQPDFINEENKGFYAVKNRLWLQWGLLTAFALAIAKFEGFYIPDSISQRHNNPGNLRPIGASTGFRSFETPEQGWVALSDQIVRNIKRGLTLDEFFLGKEGVYPGYAPLGDNPADVMENYISFVAKSMQVPRNINLITFFPDIAQMTPPMEYFYIYPLAGRDLSWIS